MKATFAVFSLLTASLLATPALASTVITTADSGPGSLRDAIANAAAGETINFAVTGTITLTSGELVINKDLTIAGPGAANLTIQRSTAVGTPEFRIFNVASGIVSISGLTVKNGGANVGGGINNETTFTLVESVVSGNSAKEKGGGINNLSTLNVSSCIIQENTAAGSVNDAFGGGINNEGTLSATTCLFNSNSVIGGAGLRGSGGAIYNPGTLSLTNSVITGNSAYGGVGSDGGGGRGGGIFNQGTMTLQTSSVSSNEVRGGDGSIAPGAAEGGGIANEFGTLTSDRCTLSGNFAEGGRSALTGRDGFSLGGAIANRLGTLIVESSTLSGNVVAGENPPSGVNVVGGGIYNDSGSVSLNHSTITANFVVITNIPGLAPELYNIFGIVGVKNTILAGRASDCILNVNGEIQSGGFNLFGSISGPVSPGTNDQFNVTSAQLKIGPLQNNGGPTFTHALLCGSPAIDAGDNMDAPPTDQRGFPRIVNGIIDIGAFEYSNSPPAIACSGGITNCAPPGGLQLTVSANVGDADGDPLVVVWTVDGTAYQTNLVAASGPPTAAQVDFTALLGEGTYTISAAVSDPSECVAVCLTPVTISPGPTVVAEYNSPVCAGGTLSLTASSATAISYHWSGPNGFTSDLQNPSITNVLPTASGTYTVTVTDSNGCTGSASTTVTIGTRGDLYPIALSQKTLTGVQIGAQLPDIYNGIQPGNFGWLTWVGSPSELTLVTSLTPPGNSSTYVNPLNRKDRVLSVGDWVRGKPGVTNSDKVRKALDTLKQIDIVVPVWDQAVGKGSKSLYHVVGFARVRITSYALPKQNRISARYLGMVECD